MNSYIQKYSGGFSFCLDKEAENLGLYEEALLNKEHSTEKCLRFQMYDADMMPSPNLSTWNPKAIEKVKQILLDKLSEYPYQVWVDDIKIKEKNQDEIL